MDRPCADRAPHNPHHRHEPGQLLDGAWCPGVAAPAGAAGENRTGSRPNLAAAGRTPPDRHQDTPEGAGADSGPIPSPTADPAAAAVLNAARRYVELDEAGRQDDADRALDDLAAAVRASRDPGPAGDQPAPAARPTMRPAMPDQPPPPPHHPTIWT